MAVAASSQPGYEYPGVVPAAWEFAGLLLTYWCNARCAFCYVYSGPDRSGRMSTADALELWKGLDRHAAGHGKTMRVHLAGGEPLADWPGLLGLVRAARDAGLTPVEKIETNAFWATRDGLTRARLEQLDALGVQRLVVSTDLFHQEFVPFERVRRCVEIARQVLGKGRVRVRWWDFFHDPRDVRRLDLAQKNQAYLEALGQHADRLTGRAADRLAPLLPCRPASDFRGLSCRNELLGSRHVHIDYRGNVFPGVCNGIILGNALRQPAEAVWQRFARHWQEHPVVSAAATGGSFELMQRAKSLGYRELSAGYASKCHLCHHVRQFLHQRGVWPDAIGPAECYGP